jgi:hypothetical protein
MTTTKDVEDYTDEELSSFWQKFTQEYEDIKNTRQSEKKSQLRSLISDIEDEQSYRKRCRMNGEPYIVPPPPPGDPTPAHSLVEVLYDISIPGAVYTCCLDPEYFPFEADHELVSTKVNRGRGFSVVYERLSKKMVMEILEYLDKSRIHLAALSTIEDKELSYRIKEVMNMIKGKLS